MEHCAKVAGETFGQPPSPVLDDLPLLGFMQMVSPSQKIASTQHPYMGRTTIPRHVSRLPRDLDECAKMAPSLLHVIRTIFQREQIPVKTQETYLAQIKSIKRYDSAFRKLWELCKSHGVHPETASIPFLASQILQLSQYSLPEARNAYSACLLLPGTQGLRFHPLLQLTKKKWNTSIPRYPEFWDMSIFCKNWGPPP